MKVLNKYNIFFIAVLVLLAGYFLFFVNIVANEPIPEKISKIEINNTIVYLDTAQTIKEKSIGLGARDSMLQDHGMLFDFAKKDFYIFWMKGMRFPLDIIWLDDYEVVTILENAPVIKSGEMPRYTSKSVANYVLEVNAGFVDKHNIKIGDKVIYK